MEEKTAATLVDFKTNPGALWADVSDGLCMNYNKPSLTLRVRH